MPPILLNILVGAAVLIPAAFFLVRGVLNLKRGKVPCCRSAGCASCPAACAPKGRPSPDAVKRRR